MEFPVPAQEYTSIGELIMAACSCLRRPCPARYRHIYGASALQQPDDSFTTALEATTTGEAKPTLQDLEAMLEEATQILDAPSTSAATPTLEATTTGEAKPTFQDLEAMLEEATPTLEATSSTCLQAQAVTPGSPMSPILAYLRHDWGLEYYMRVDRGGSFHTYPDLGGPFQSMQQAEDAIDRYLHGCRDSKMCMEQAGVSRQEMGIRQCLYWPDGTRKKRTKSYIFKKGLEHTCRLVSAVVDQYNEDHNLLRDLAYELKDVVEHQSFHEKEEWYRHLNFTAKIKGADGLD